MSQASKPTVDINIFSELSLVTVEDSTTSASAINRTPKRGADDQANDQVKKIKVEQNSDEKHELKINRKFDNQLSFIPASQFAARQTRTTTELPPEISDEELLAMAIEFEKRHPEYN